MTKNKNVITKDEVLQIRLTTDEKAKIKELAKKKGYTMSELVVYALIRMIAEDEFYSKNI